MGVPIEVKGKAGFKWVEFSVEGEFQKSAGLQGQFNETLCEECKRVSGNYTEVKGISARFLGGQGNYMRTSNGFQRVVYVISDAF